MNLDIYELIALGLVGLGVGLGVMKLAYYAATRKGAEWGDNQP